jgi:hypothetical protein
MFLPPLESARLVCMSNVTNYDFCDNSVGLFRMAESSLNGYATRTRAESVQGRTA